MIPRGRTIGVWRGGASLAKTSSSIGMVVFLLIDARLRDAVIASAAVIEFMARRHAGP